MARALRVVVWTLFGTCSFLSMPISSHAQAHPVTPEEIDKRIAQLGAERFTVREQASKRLEEIGAAALPALHTASNSDDAEVRKRSLDLIQVIEASVGYLLESLRNKDLSIRRQAAANLERRGLHDKAMLPALQEALKDKDENVHEAVVNALIGLDATLPVLAKEIPKTASAAGKYRGLQRRIKIAEDKKNYSDFHEWGFWEGKEWAGYTDLPKGFWVYSYPHWYIWREKD